MFVVSIKEMEESEQGEKAQSIKEMQNSRLF